MKSTQRQAAAAAGLLVLVLMGAPAIAAAQPRQGPEQRGGPAGPDTKGMLVATFKSDDRQLGVQAADAVRRRLQDEYTMKQLNVISKRGIDATLEQSGYKPDSALSASDLMELGKQVRADYVLDGSASKTAEGVKVEVRMLLRRGQTTYAQPFAPVTSKNVGDAAKEIHRSIAEALKSMPGIVSCENNIRAQKYDVAVSDARTVLTTYPASTLGKLCMLQAFTQSKAAPDSIIRVAKDILANDPGSIIALGYLADAYNAKGAKESAIETMVKLWRADPSNASLAEGIIQALGQSGAPDKALPIIDDMLKDNPGDPKMLSTKWKLLLPAKRYKEAIAVGEEWVKVDTAAANLDFFNRMAAAAALDSNPQLSMQYMARGVRKYPKDADLQLQYANALYKAGQLQQALTAAQTVIALNPKSTSAYTILLVTQTQTNQLDSAMATAQKAMAAGVDKQTVADVLVAVLAPAMKKAQETKTRDDWTEALKTAQTVDAIAPSFTTKFYIGVASFSIASDIATSLQATVADIQKSTKNATPANKAKACEQAKQVEDNLATTSIAMPAGAKMDTNTAGQIMGAVQQYGEYIANVKKAFCK